ncbi:MAG: YdcF family protein [Trueperaceae bacterium]|nr:YdcF family protein [Trueperaceae bacterium]
MNLQSDLTWTLLQPSNLVIMLILFSLLCLIFGGLKLGRSSLFLAVIFLLLPALLPLEDIVASPLENRLQTPLPLPNSVEGILVLGGAVDWDVSRSRQMLSTNNGAERMMAAAALAQRYPNAQLVFTGLFREIIPNEFNTLANPSSFFFGPEYSNRQIIYVGGARSTYEEALLAIETVKPQAGERWLLVTSAYHMPRAYLTFQAQGWTVIPYPVDYRHTGKLVIKPTLKIAARLSDLDDYVREWGALIMYNRLGRTEKLLP